MIKELIEPRMRRIPTRRSKLGTLRGALALSIAAFSGASIAGDMTGVIREVHLGPVYGTKVFLKIDGTASGQPACQTNAGYKFVFDADSATGRALLATALAAQVSGQVVKLNGDNQCTLFGTVEDLRWLSIGT